MPTRRPIRPLVLAPFLVVLTLLGACTPLPELPELPGQTGASTEGLTRADVDAWLDGFVPDALEEGRIAGATVTVVHDGEILTARGFGEADVAAGRPVDAGQTLFRVGSVSKMVTATAVMQLVEQGEVDLDTDVEEYTGLGLDLPYPVTLRHLLTHTPGFEERLAGLITPDGPPADLRASLLTDPPEQVYEPGTTPAYSNYGNALAGYVVEAVSGMPFERYVEENVLAPAGMTSSSFAQPLPDALADDAALGYPTVDDPPLGFEVVGQPPAGALSATATDMGAFLLAHLGHPVGGEEILSADNRALMQAPALDESTLGGLAAGPRMGLGWFDESRNGHRVVGHGGDTLAFHSHLQLWPDDDTGLFLSLNSTGADGFAAHLLREGLLWGFADRYFPAADDPVAVPGDDAPVDVVDPDIRREHAEALAGIYEPARGFRSTFLSALGPLQPTRVEVVDGDRVRFSPAPVIPWPAEYEEISPWVYREVGRDHILAVDVDEEGQVRLIGHDSAMSLTPLSATRVTAVPAFAGTVAVLLLVVLAWPVIGLIGRIRVRRRATAAQGEGSSALGVVPARSGVRWPRWLTWLAALAAVVAGAGWVHVLLTLTGLQPLPAVTIRAVQVVTLLAVVGVPGAVWLLIAALRTRAGWSRVVAAGVLIVAFVVLAWSVGTLNLLSLDITY